MWIRSLLLLVFLYLAANAQVFVRQYTVGNLPATDSTNATAIVTDGFLPGDCLAGHGHFTVVCSFNGTGWVPQPGGTEINVLSLGVPNNGTTNAQPSIAAALALNQSVVFPDGDYLIDLSSFTVPWTIQNITGSVRFTGGARWVIKAPTNKSVNMIDFEGATNFTLLGFHLTFLTDPTTCLQVGGAQCGSTFFMNGGSNILIRDFTEDESQSGGLIAENDSNLTIENANLTNTGGSLELGISNLHLTNFNCYAVRDDCINIGSSFASPNNFGAIVQGLHVDGSYARCALLASSNIVLDGFSCAHAQVGGIGIEYSSNFDSTIRPDAIVVANGVISDIRNLGQATDPTFPESCVEIDGDQNNIGAITISHVTCERPDGQGIGVQTSYPVASLTLSDNQIYSAGNSIAGSLDGTCFYAAFVQAFQASNNICDTARSNAYYVNGNSIGTATATITGGYIHNVNTTQGSNRAVDIEGEVYFNVGGLTIADDRNPALGYIIAENATPVGGTGLFHNITFAVPHLASGFGIYSGDGRLTYQDIAPGTFLSNVPASAVNGSRVMCLDCDTPASQGAACTSSGDHAGALLQLLRGVKKCY